MEKKLQTKSDWMFNSPSKKGQGVVKWYNLPFNPALKEKARGLRKAGNLSEVLFWQQVRKKQFHNLDFDRQKIIGNYIVDFYCRDLGFVVEIDGESHNDKIEYDKERDNYLNSLGIKIFHFLDSDVKGNMEGVMQVLNDYVNTSTPATRGK